MAFSCLAGVLLTTHAHAARDPKSYEIMRGTTGCAIERLTGDPAGEYQFQGVSRDGQWLSINVSGNDQGPSRTVLMHLRTGQREALVDAFNNGGSFSPDGRHVVAAVYLEDETTDVVELDLTSGETRTIAADPAHDWLPSYSPDGRWIAFNSYRSGNSEIHIYDQEDGDLLRLTDDPAYDAHAEFSPDGTKILFHRMMGKRADGGRDYDLFAHAIATGEESRLTDSPWKDGYGSWAPDGRHVVFSSDMGEAQEHYNLHVLGPDGAVLVQLTDGDWKDSYAYWTRDGAYIYFNSDRSGNGDIYRMPMNGLDCVRVELASP